MIAWYFLIFSAVCDACYNVFLKKTTGITDIKNIIWVGLFLAGSVLGFKKGLSGIQMSVAMIAWSGVSIVSTILLDAILFNLKVDIKTAFFMGLCILSIIGLNYYSNK